MELLICLKRSCVKGEWLIYLLNTIVTKTIVPTIYFVYFLVHSAACIQLEKYETAAAALKEIYCYSPDNVVLACVLKKLDDHFGGMKCI